MAANQPNQNQPNQNPNQGQNQPVASATTSTISIPQTAAAGGITITRPDQTAPASYYKLASNALVTFGWNFTSVIATPSILHVQAYCPANSVTYTLSPQTGIPGNSFNYTWDPFAYSQSAAANNLPQLIEATYRLQVFDERGLDAPANVGGLMAPNSKVSFALYIPKSYTPLADGWVCPGCNGASHLQALSPLITILVAVITCMFFGGWSVVGRQR
ncbi:hypothetical protein CF319_g5151 [Tilletia indica]|uniref:DUF7137 domain-containing protein n=2 Tax=Tilletia TaxID=13289 RepID=A0A8X7N7T6_9BASI|nr:hypothetical protein CF327_g5313 [Tilletia walkeri]KAE8221501.1 hypothetical protein CF319_g5151 [Tilletia indica]KAE8230034.1 hypothetical protein CF326_g4979 [Tilletia indica]KAE8241554.1 hypothetical protein A4X13_0g7362 [Tilletia indica]KAE8268294.1 hypothetical protein A4X09_0g4060 [Tilletia walkeri]